MNQTTVDQASTSQEVPILDDSEAATDESLPVDTPNEHPIQVAIDRLVHRIRDIEDVAQFVPLILERQAAEVTAIAEDLTNVLSAVRESTEAMRGAAFKKTIDSGRRLIRLREAQPARALRLSLFLGVFSAYEAYLGDLLRALFTARSELFNRIGGDVSLAQVMAASSLEEIKAGIIDKFIEDLRRDSYINQFGQLQRLFDIELGKFDNWSAFIEASQRRNLLAHADGEVSDQYIRICNSEGHTLPETLRSGQRLDVEDTYLRTCCRLVMEVTVKLGHVLWRKVLPDLLEQADLHLHELAYQGLQLQEWDWATIIGEFALSQRKVSSDLNRRIAIVNSAIALRYKEGLESGRGIMAKYDWSSCCGELRLAQAVLNDDYDRASDVMREIGKKGAFLQEHSYHTWPLFRDFRDTPQFIDAYSDIYDHEFVTELQKEVAQAERRLSTDEGTTNST